MAEVRPPAEGESGHKHVDPEQEDATSALRQFFAQERSRVFYSRQLEVHLEDRWFHWVTNRALRELVLLEEIKSEPRHLSIGIDINLMWHRGFRYYRREASKLVRLVEEYVNPEISESLGHHGELMVLEGFAGREFILRGRHTRTFGSRTWTQTRHNLDFIFEKDGIAYGVEVKNTLGYMEHEELEIKIEMCHDLGLRPVSDLRG